MYPGLRRDAENHIQKSGDVRTPGPYGLHEKEVSDEIIMDMQNTLCMFHLGCGMLIEMHTTHNMIYIICIIIGVSLTMQDPTHCSALDLLRWYKEIRHYCQQPSCGSYALSQQCPFCRFEPVPSGFLNEVLIYQLFAWQTRLM